ncbi:MAG TPA: PQQ-dependent sugar dehydrogenase [Micropepsaceae bacterium]|nr:PQQ-dependent sugar dehydrogenase [Micropepsaceae bacterium]
MRPIVLALPVFAAVLAAAPAQAVEIIDPSRYQVTEIAAGLDHPWSIAFLPDGSMLVTERNAGLRVIRDGALLPDPVANVPPTFVSGQGGLLDVVLHPDFAQNQTIYLTYSSGDDSASATTVARARYDAAAHALLDVAVIFSAYPTKDTPQHYGGRMVFLPDGTFVLTLGDGFNFREQAQKLDSDLGKFVRLNADGSIPADNPFVGREGARGEIFTYGHRNPQAIVFNPLDGRIYAHEHGPQGGDEINLIEGGRNYGWPAITYGLDYSGAIITPYTELPGMEQPLHVWTPSIAPAGMSVYTGDLFAGWKGDLIVAALVSTDLRRIDMEGGKVVGEYSLLAEREERLRDVRMAPDGALYVLTDEDDGKVLRVVPVE